MSDFALNDTRPDTQAAAKPYLHRKPHVSVVAVFLLFLISSIGYAGYGVFTDTHNVGEPLALSALALLGVALLIALGFEFVNGFHDTANAVATVIYTHSLPPLTASSTACRSPPRTFSRAASPAPWRRMGPDCKRGRSETLCWHGS